MTQSREGPIRAFLHSLQADLCQVFGEEDGQRTFQLDAWTRTGAASHLSGGGTTAACSPEAPPAIS